MIRCFLECHLLIRFINHLDQYICATFIIYLLHQHTKHVVKYSNNIFKHINLMFSKLRRFAPYICRMVSRENIVHYEALKL